MTSNIVTMPELKNRSFVFRDRDHAGAVLADMIRADIDPDNSLLLAIPAGGVPVAMAMSRELGIAFDIAVVSKITLPWNTEAGYGAVAFDGTTRLNEPMLARLNLTDTQVRDGIKKTKEKVNRRTRELRGQQPMPQFTDKTAVLADDGLASGFTMFCAIEAVKNAGAENIFVAVPTAHQQAAEAAGQKAARVYCANIRSGFSFAVAEAYENWYDITEPELAEMLGK